MSCFRSLIFRVLRLLSALLLDSVVLSLMAAKLGHMAYLCDRKFKAMAGAENIKPYHNSEAEKKEQVAEMFDNISKRYDFLNHILSLNIDKGWRRKVVRMIQADQPSMVLDVATGTADLAIALANGTGANITGADISEGMLSVGRDKINKKGLSKKIVLNWVIVKIYLIPTILLMPSQLLLVCVISKI